MRGMGSRSARHTLIAVTGLVFCTLAPLITVLCFINGSLATHRLGGGKQWQSENSWKPQTNGRPSEVLCSDLRFGTAECGKRQKPNVRSVEAKETLWTYFSWPRWGVVICTPTSLRPGLICYFLFWELFWSENGKKNKLQILMLCQLMNQSYRKNYSFSMCFLNILFASHCSSKLTLRFMQRRGRLGVLSEFTKLRSCRFPRWSRLT